MGLIKKSGASPGIHRYKFALFLIPLFILGCSDSSDPCAKSWQMLKNPRLDVIADNIANLRAKIASGNGTKEDSQRIYRLQEEENQIWNAATAACH